MLIARNFVRLVAFVAGLGGIAGFAQTTNSTPASAAPTNPKVAFMGDSITQFGAGPSGYVTLVGKGMEKAGRPIVIIPAGVSGNTSKDMLARFQRDVLDKKPDWMTLSCGVNDVWHGDKGVPLDQYKTNITSIVDQATAAGIKVYILTATMIMENPENDLNKKLAPYNEFLRGLAKERNLPLADLNADMQAELAAEKTAAPGIAGSVLTVDGVHMNGLGNEMMAAGVLKAFGLSDAQVTEAREAWLDLPDGAPVTVKGSFTVREYRALLHAAAAQKISVEELLNRDLAKDVNELQASAPAKP